MKEARYRLNGTGTFARIGWSYVSIENGGGCPCDNCGALITTHVTVQRNDGQKFIVGSDCAKTLSGINGKEIKEIERIISRDSKNIKEYSNGNYLYADNGENVAILKYSITDFSGRPFFNITYKCSVSKKVFGNKPLTTETEVKAIAPELLNTFGYKAYFLNEIS